MITQVYDRLQQYEPRIEIKNKVNLLVVILPTHIARKNGGERFIKKSDN